METEITATTENNADETHVSAQPRKASKLPQILAYISIVATYVAAVVLGNSKVVFSTDTGSAAVADAISNYQLNDMSSKTVYNQMVTNGWAAKDLLKAIGDQNATIIDNQLASAQLIQGTNALLTYGLGMVAIIGIAVIVILMSKKR